MSELFLELLDLHADGGRCQAQDLARPDDGALGGHGPEIQKVVIVQPAHTTLTPFHSRGDLPGQHTPMPGAGVHLHHRDDER